MFERYTRRTRWPSTHSVIIVQCCACLLFFFLLLGRCLARTDAQDITSRCRMECSTTLATRTGDVHCNDTCRANQCTWGCGLWLDAADSNCENVCNKTLGPLTTPVKHLHCNVGCRFAAYLYVQSVKDELGAAPQAPVLVAQTQTNVSVSIRWKGPPKFLVRDVSYLVLWKYDSLPGGWEYYRPKAPIRNGTVQRIDGLHPYTKYKFRVAWIVLSKQDLILSDESICISTLAYGAPLTAPTVTSVTPIDPTRVSVTWEPPSFPNGPILSYVVHLSQENTSLIKDVPEPNADNFFIFNNLRPNTTYVVSVACRNSVGESPKRVRNVTTPPDASVTTASQAFLVIGTETKVVRQSIETLEEPQVLFRPADESVHVRGLSVHVEQGLLFVSDSVGAIHRVAFQQAEVGRPETIVAPSGHDVRAVSVDWLNDMLYFVQDDQISRCDLDGSDRRVVVTGLSRVPSDLKVDPFNGFLYWVLQGSPSGGLYYVDLDDAAGVFSERHAQVLVSDDHLTTLTVDHRNFRVLVVNDTANTIVATSVSGKSEPVDIRWNTQRAKFRGTKAMAIFHDLLYWTSGEEVYGEEHLDDRYYHNAILVVVERPFVALDVVHPDTQPIPVPVNPVQSVQALFHESLAHVAWLPPKPLGGLGRGAWQRWQYEVDVEDTQHNVTVVRKNVTGHRSSVDHLRPNTTHTVRVRGYSKGGRGPWSDAFRGKTQKRATTEGYPYVLWSAAGTLLKSDVIGEKVQPLIHGISSLDLRVTDMAWYEDLVFLNTNTSQVYAYNTSNHSSFAPVPNVTSAISIAVDWLGRKLYWSNPKQQMISRANLDGSEQEPLLILTMAKDLNVDSVGGRIYWTTTHSVESARLNGAEPTKYFQAGFFSGRRVVGLALDHDRNRLVWMVCSFDGAKLYQAPIASSKEEFVSSFLGPLQDDDAVQGPIRYFGDQLYWLRNSSEAVISDLTGRNAAHLHSVGVGDLSTLLVVDPSLHPLPSGGDGRVVTVVIPEAVDAASVKVSGSWNCFNISWSPASNVNHGRVFYEVGVDDTVMTSEEPYLVYPCQRPLPPFSTIALSVRAFTYWGSSVRTDVAIHSPMTVPSEPQSPRVYVTFDAAGSVRAEFRWTPPRRPNGIVLGYVVTVWNGEPQGRDPLWEEDVPDRLVANITRPLARNQTYFFQVRGYTEAGEGASSDTVVVHTRAATPVPKLLVAKDDAIELVDVDNGARSVVLGGEALTTPTDVVYLEVDRTFFWLDRRASALMRSNDDGTGRTKLLSLDRPGDHLCLDWVGRKLFWTESGEVNTSIRVLDLDVKSSARVVVTVHGRIGDVQVDPLSSILVWTSSGTLMRCKLDGSEVLPLMRPPEESSENCNCPRDAAVEPLVAVDTSDSGNVLWVDSRSKWLWSADVRGCHCQRLWNNTSFDGATSMTVDENFVYWSDTKSIAIFRRHPKEGGSVGAESMRVLQEEGNLRSIRAVGPHLQPYPNLRCLVPAAYDESPQVVGATDTTLTLVLAPPTTIPAGCSAHVSTAPVLFTIYYSATGGQSDCDNGLGVTGCHSMETHSTTAVVSGLRPFTTYSLRVSVSNFYAATPVGPGPEVRQRTEEGVPTIPRNVTAVAVSPEEVEVRWVPPESIRGPSVRYSVHWSGAPNERTSEDATGSLRRLVTGLQPGRRYDFWVRSHVAHGTGHNDSGVVSVLTFGAPSDLVVDNVTATSVTLSWTSPSRPVLTRHALQYNKVYNEAITTGAFETTDVGRKYVFRVVNLAPVSRYFFRLLLVYNASDGVVYRWPKNDGLSVITPGDRPSPPGTPEVLNVQHGVFKVLWKASGATGGGRHVDYVLEAHDGGNWTTVYNGSETSWPVSGLGRHAPYVFRVHAVNEFGVGDLSDRSRVVTFDDDDLGTDFGARDDRLAVILGSCIPILIVFLAGLSYVLFKVYRSKEKDKKMLQEMVLNLHAPDVELATLRDLPRNHSFVHQNNALYALSDVPSDAELAGLPHVSSSQIVLIKFLGCGAFGEVFEGVAHTLPGRTEADIRVAVKTLRKGAMDHEKAEFLKEAQLMSNFKHDHILSLLGVCLDNDPNFLILELMEGGDLLSFLRNNRPNAVSPSSLGIQELVSICLDVAKGCAHLEDMHFIHRDLAARNCLVSSHDRTHRVVKIGDFGLARDIYKSDYYRKEGEGLLPVRWMSPESLVDGVFTSQSDVWAFGVLLWEVMTLGQQPYPARTNVEVLHYVRGGGRLDKPDNCPDDLHQLMLRCWSYNPNERPTFKFCLEQLKELERKSSHLPPLNCVHNQNYVGRQQDAAAAELAGVVSGGVDNPAYTTDEGVQDSSGEATSAKVSPQTSSRPRVSEAETASLSSSVTERHVGRLSSETDNDESADLLDGHQQQIGSHRYLELLYDNDLPPAYESDGYEIPLSSSSIRRKNASNVQACVAPRPRTLSMDSSGDGTDDAKQHALELVRTVPWLRRRGASQPLLSWSRDSVTSAAGLIGGGISAPTIDSLWHHHNNSFTSSCQRFWRDSSISLGTEGSLISDKVDDDNMVAASSHLSGMSALSDLSGLSSSSTSGIDDNYTPTSTWC